MTVSPPQPLTPADIFTWTSLIGPAVVAAVISGLVSAIGILISARTARGIHAERLVFDRDQAERRFGYERELAERKFAYDREFNDHKRRVELAEEVLAGFLKMRDIIREIRSPAAFGSEGEDRPANEGETGQQARARRGYFVPASRLMKHSDFINHLMTKRYQMNAYFGPQAEVPFNMIWDVLTHIQSAVRMMMMSINAQGYRQGGDAQWQRWESAIWEGSETPDPHADTVEEAISKMEIICRPVLSGRDA